MKTFVRILILSLMFVPTSGHTQGKCADLSSLSAMEQVECAGRSFEKADKELNGVYKQVLVKLGKSDFPPDVRKDYIKDFRAAQRAWVSFKEATCALAQYDFYGAAGGAGATGATVDCLKSFTEQRIQDLKNFMDGKGAPGSNL